MMAAMFCLFYIFAMIGMVLFGGDVTKSTVTQQYEHAVDTKNEEMAIYWKGVLESFYFLNNFNDFMHSMVTLMELSIVNNWQVISQTFIAMKDNDYYRVYFIAFYFFAVILLLNIIVAFILDVFITQYSKNFSENSLLYRYKKYVMMSILIHQLQDCDKDFDLLHWQITRRVRPALLMQSLFENLDTNNTMNSTNTNSIATPVKPSFHDHKHYDNHHLQERNQESSQKHNKFRYSELSRPSVMDYAASQRTSHSPSDSLSPPDFRSRFLLSNTSRSSASRRMISSPLKSNRSRQSTVSLRARPSLSMLSMIAMQSSNVPTQSGSSATREDMQVRDVVDYDDLVQMPWGQESLFQDFLHLYNNDEYYKKKHELRNRNFARVSTSNMFRRQMSTSALCLERGLDGFHIDALIDEEHETKIDENETLDPQDNVYQNMMSDLLVTT